MSGVHAPDTGLIRLGEKTFNSLSPREAVREGVQVIFQDFSLLPNLTVAENIALPTYISNNSRFLSKRESKEIARTALDLIGVDIDINSPVADISIASKQLIAIARATNLGVKMLFIRNHYRCPNRSRPTWRPLRVGGPCRLNLHTCNRHDQRCGGSRAHLPGPSMD